VDERVIKKWGIWW